MQTLLAILTNPAKSEDFIKYTLSMSVDLGCYLHFLYIQNPAMYTISTGTATTTPHPVANDLDVQMLETDRENVLEQIRETLDGIKENAKPGSIEVSAEAGTMSIVVDHFISNNKAHMVVIEGNDDSGFFTSEYSGTDVISKVNCPGWVIPSGMTYTPFKNIIYATDYQDADIATLKRLIALTKKISPKITALHITDSEDFEEKTMQHGFKDMVAKDTGYDNIVVKTEKEDKDIEEKINDVAINAHADLIVLLKENKGFIEKIFTRSSTKKVIRKAKLPVLVYHEK